MKLPLALVLLLICCFAMAAKYDDSFRNWNGHRNKSDSVMEVLIGDSRRLFANHFFAKADAYFHSGYYPTIFDHPKTEGKSHMQETAHQNADAKPDAHSGHGHEEAEADFLGPPIDWIEKVGRNFFPVTHSHLEKNGDEREMLPWFRLAAELDPQAIETYVSAAYWLRNRLGKVDEAEQFLREGLRNNPESYELLTEIGRIEYQNRKNFTLARNLWELALQKWRRQNAAGLKPDDFVHEQLLGLLVRLEDQQGNWKQELEYLEELKNISPDRELIEKHIRTVKAKVDGAH